MRSRKSKSRPSKAWTATKINCDYPASAFTR